MVLGQILLKSGVQQVHHFVWTWSCIRHQILLNRDIMVGLFFIIATNLLWLYMLKVYAFSVIYPLTSIGFVIGMLAGMVFFKETVVWTQWIGVLLIMGGCWFIVK